MMDANKIMQTFLEQRIDQRAMSVRAFIEKNGEEEIAGLLRRFSEMAKSDDPGEVMMGCLAGFGLAVALRDHYAARADKARG